MDETLRSLGAKVSRETVPDPTSFG
jgi:hypothetical protein